MAAAFGVDAATVWRWDKAYAAGGVAGLVPGRRGPKGAWRLSPGLVAEIRRLRGQGWSYQAVAERAGVSVFSVRRALGVAGEPVAFADEAVAVDRAEPADRSATVDGAEPAERARADEAAAARGQQLDMQLSEKGAPVDQGAPVEEGDSGEGAPVEEAATVQQAGSDNAVTVEEGDSGEGATADERATADEGVSVAEAAAVVAGGAAPGGAQRGAAAGACGVVGRGAAGVHRGATAAVGGGVAGAAGAGGHGAAGGGRGCLRAAAQQLLRAQECAGDVGGVGVAARAARRGRQPRRSGRPGAGAGVGPRPGGQTIRRKLAELAGHGKAGALLEALARRHVEGHPDAVGFLYVDGHVRAYHGTRRLPKAHVARMRIAMPATAETWVCDAGGDPVFVVTAPPSASTVAEVRRLLPELRGLVGERRVTVVFDRGGWSPGLFADILDAGFDFLTYRKGRVRREPAGAFAAQVWTDERGVEHCWELADRRIRLRLPAGHARRLGKKTIAARQVTRRSPDGHQTPVVTSRTDLAAVEVAARAFARWRQENYFRYGRAHFALDALDSYAAVDDDADRSVPNPARARAQRRLRTARAGLAAAEAAYGAAAHDNPEGQRRSMRGFKIAHADAGRALRAARAEVARREAELQRTPARVPLGTVAADAKLLDPEVKLLTHAVRMAAYNTETTLARELAPHYARAHDEARALLREAVRLAGDIHIHNGRLHVRLNPASAPRRTRALAALCDQLNDTQTPYPGTDLTVVYSVKPHPGLA